LHLGLMIGIAHHASPLPRLRRRKCPTANEQQRCHHTERPTEVFIICDMSFPPRNCSGNFPATIHSLVVI
jgi:hypothetical protein